MTVGGVGRSSRDKSFLVKVQLRTDLASQDRDTVVVSRDIWEELRPSQFRGARYIALASKSSYRWAVHAARPASSAKSEIGVIKASPHLFERFGDATIRARPIGPVCLSSLYLVFPPNTYATASGQQDELRELVERGHVWRTGEQIELNGCRGRIQLCEPVRQGVANTSTEIVFVRGPGNEARDRRSARVNGFCDDHVQDFDETSMSMDADAPMVGGLDSALTNSTSTETVQLKSLRYPLILLSAAHGSAKDPNLRAYASVETLMQAGLFTGDTVEISADGKSPARLFKVCALPSDYDNPKAGVVYLSPVVHFNMLGRTGSKRSTVRKTSRSISQTPVAKSVTLARIPSPASTDRVLQDAFIDAMKRYFEGVKRSVRCGDLLMLGIDETLARLSYTGGAQADTAAEDTLAGLSQETDTFAWFKVLEVQTEEEASFPGDVIVDSSNTRMVQQGVEKARVPAFEDWARYCGLDVPVATDTSVGFAKDLYDLIASTFSDLARSGRASATVVLHGARGSGKKTLASSVAARLGMHLLDVNCYELIGESDVKTEAYLRLRFEKAGQCSPCLLLLRNIDALAKKKDDLENGQESAMRFVLSDCLRRVAEDAGDYPVAVIGTTSDKDKIPEGVLGCFRHEVAIPAPDETARLSILRTVTRNLNISPDISLQALAVKSAALVATDLVNVAARARYHSQDRLEDFAAASEPSTSTDDLEAAGFWVSTKDVDAAIDEARKNYSDSIGAPKIPNVTWDDVGGLASVKDDIMDTIQLPLERPELFASGMKKRSGILFYGPPGTGKTLLAKAVATSFSLNFFSVKGPELLNMYIGESEANVRRVFQRARDARPCVVFFDELDSVAPKRGNQGDSGGVMDRIVSQLLSELDGMSEGKDGGGGGVFVIGATNRPDLLDPALLRPGRFDKMLYLGISETDDQQLNILQALTRKFKLHPDLDLRSIARQCPFTYTGADFYALCSDAMLKAMTRQAGVVDAEVKSINAARAASGASGAEGKPISTQYFFDHLARPEHTDVLVTEPDFVAALRELVPSVSRQELDHYKRVQAQFTPPKKDAVPAAVTAMPAAETLQSSGHHLDADQARKAAKGKGRAIDLPPAPAAVFDDTTNDGDLYE